jgi:hypothetical protein
MGTDGGEVLQSHNASFELTRISSGRKVRARGTF